MQNVNMATNGKCKCRLNPIGEGVTQNTCWKRASDRRHTDEQSDASAMRAGPVARSMSGLNVPAQTVVLPVLCQKLLKCAACRVTAKVCDVHESTVLPRLGIEEIQQAQRKDPVLGRIWYYVERGHEPAQREKQKEPSTVAKLMQQWDRLQICTGRLCRTMMDPTDGSKVTQLLLPSTRHSTLDFDVQTLQFCKNATSKGTRTNA